MYYSGRPDINHEILLLKRGIVAAESIDLAARCSFSVVFFPIHSIRSNNVLFLKLPEPFA